MRSSWRAAPRRFPVRLAAAVLVTAPGLYLGAAAYLGVPHPGLPPSADSTIG